MYTVLRENEFFECQQVKLCIYSAKFKKKKKNLSLLLLVFILLFGTCQVFEPWLILRSFVVFKSEGK